jgi:hypothetical protein
MYFLLCRRYQSSAFSHIFFFSFFGDIVTFDECYLSNDDGLVQLTVLNRWLIGLSIHGGGHQFS